MLLSAGSVLHRGRERQRRGQLRRRRLVTAPVWMASPPEVHSALLSSGPGPQSLLAAAGAWNSLSAEYASTAEELSAALAAAQADVWEGPSAESYVAAHGPYLAWLTQASTDSAAAAAQHETAGAAYGAALAAMPTLAELAANHTAHAALVATNFFGINTIPIAVNEADYVRMWVQAATTMAAYQAVSSAAVASTPQPTPAPQIQKTTGTASAQVAALAQTVQSGSSTGLGSLLESEVDKLGLWPLLHQFGIGHLYTFLNNPVAFIEQDIHKFLANPLAMLLNPLLVFFGPDDIPYMAYQALAPLITMAYPAFAVAPAGAGLAGLAGIGPAAMPAVAPALAPVAAAPTVLPAAGVTPTVLTSVAGPGTAPAPPPTHMASTMAGSPPPAPPTAAVGNFVPPYAVGPPGIGFDSRLPTSAGASAQRKAPEPDNAAAAAAAAAACQEARARRRRRATVADHADEYADMNVDVDPDWGAPPSDRPLTSGNGAAALGFAGTVRTGAVERAAGLATLGGDGFGGGPRMPMMPGSWGAEHPDGS